MVPLTLSIILLLYALDFTLAYLNYRHRHHPIPQNVADVYSEERYGTWLRYTMEVHRLGLFSKTLHTMMLLLFLALGFFPALARFTQGYVANPAGETLLFLGLYFLLQYLLGFGFRWYRTFHIEERYGFNRTTRKTFLLDQGKSLLLTVLLGGPLLFGLLSLYRRQGPGFVLTAWGLILIFELLVLVLYTRVFLRIFNKLTPLPQGPLREKLEKLAHDTGYEVKRISVMDASKRSKRLNAFFSGFGRFKDIVLFDTLLEKMDEDAVAAVLAHEIGHAKHRDILRNFVSTTLQVGVYLSLLTFFLESDAFAQAFGFPAAHWGFALVLFSILTEPLGILLEIPLSALSRRAEYRADAFARKFGYGEALVRALKILAQENFANLTPHPLVVRMTYSHPPVSQRIHALTTPSKH